MKRIKGVWIQVFFGALMILGAILIYLYVTNKTGNVQPCAKNLGELDLSVETKAYSGMSRKEEIRLWQNEEGIYFAFLPSYADETKVNFCNLESEASVLIDGQSYSGKDNLHTLAEDDTVRNIMLCHAGEIVEEGQICFLQSQNLGTIYIDTESGNTELLHSEKGLKEGATMHFVNEDGSDRFCGKLEYIKTRGNSTFDVEKKSYTIKLNQETALIEGDISKKWILLANAYDMTMLKNHFVNSFAANYTSVPAMAGEYVDLYLDGEYVGNYYLCGKIEVSETRVNIVDLEEKNRAVNWFKKEEDTSYYVSENGNIKATKGLNNPSDITGGYLLEHISDGKYESITNGFCTDTGHCYEVLSPCPATIEEVEYICNFFNEMETAMANEEGVNPDTGKHLSEYLDYDSYATKYVMEETFHDPDACAFSIYFYKDSDAINTKIQAGPMWDYDRALGSSSYQYYYDNPHQKDSLGVYIQEMLKFEDVRSLVCEKFETIVEPYVDNLAKADIYNKYLEIKSSVQMDDVRWPSTGYGYYASTEANVEYLNEFITKKASYLKSAWLDGEDEYCTVCFLDYDKLPIATYSVKKGETISQTPKANCYVALFAGWYVRGTDIPYVADLPILEDTTYESRWIDMDLILLNGINGAGLDIMSLNPEDFEVAANTLRIMQEQQAADMAKESGN